MLYPIASAPEYLACSLYLSLTLPSRPGSRDVDSRVTWPRTARGGGQGRGRDSRFTDPSPVPSSAIVVRVLYPCLSHAFSWSSVRYILAYSYTHPTSTQIDVYLSYDVLVFLCIVSCILFLYCVQQIGLSYSIYSFTFDQASFRVLSNYIVVLF